MVLRFSTNNLYKVRGSRYRWYSFYSFMTSVSPNGPGWTCVGSSNGTSGAMIDGYITGPSSLGTNSWMVLRSPINKEFLIRITSTDYATITYSKAGLFTGGINATPPTASDSLSVITATNLFYDESVWNICADDAFPYGFYMYAHNLGEKRITGGFFAYIPMDGYHETNDTDPYVMMATRNEPNVSGPASLTLSDGAPHCWTPNGTTQIQIGGNFQSSTTTFLSLGTQVPIFDLMFINVSAPYAFKGTSRFVRRFAGRYLVLDKTILGDNRQYIKIANLVLPWNGDVAL